MSNSSSSSVCRHSSSVALGIAATVVCQGAALGQSSAIAPSPEPTAKAIPVHHSSKPQVSENHTVDFGFGANAANSVPSPSTQTKAPTLSSSTTASVSATPTFPPSAMPSPSPSADRRDPSLNFDLPKSQLPAPAPAPAPAASSSPIAVPPPAGTPSDTLPPSLANLFVGDSNSLAAIAIGSAEGTRTPSGGKTWAFNGHTDPGNGVWNLGTFSWQHGASSPEEADRKQLARLQRQAVKLNKQAIAMGVPWGLEEHLNALDLANQSPSAALNPGGFMERLKQAHNDGLRGTEAILWARTWSYRHPSGTRWNAPGLGNTHHGIRTDQNRRMREIAKAIAASPGYQTTPPATAQAAAPVAPQPNAQAAAPFSANRSSQASPSRPSNPSSSSESQTPPRSPVAESPSQRSEWSAARERVRQRLAEESIINRLFSIDVQDV